MKKLLVEIKARCDRPEDIRKILQLNNADFKGFDHQLDTYFKVSAGRFKLRQGKIENSLIHYQRSNQAGPKDSLVTLTKFAERQPELKTVLDAAIGTLIEVDKQREIYFIDNVKFHLDSVKGLGSFVEIEAIGTPGLDQRADLMAQCEHYLQRFAIKSGDLVEVSYSDLLLEKMN